jgi:diaminopimelate dehydrogenase
MTRRRAIAIVGLGRLGAACLETIRESSDLAAAGVVRRPESGPAPHGVPTVNHVRDLGHVDAALVCVPATLVAGAARELLQARIPVVECAMLEDRSLEAHYAGIGDAARNHRTAAVLGAGWNPGVLPLLRHAFEMLIPEGHTAVSDRPGVSLHHAEAVRGVRGVRDALVAEQPDAEGRLKRYVYAELAKGTDAAAVQAALAADPLFAGEETLLFPVESVAAMEAEGRGVLLERRGTGRSGAHQNLLLEARFDLYAFAARVMVDAARRLERLGPGAHRYALWPAGATG